jgi:hypothetical protein
MSAPYIQLFVLPYKDGKCHMSSGSKKLNKQEFVALSNRTILQSKLPWESPGSSTKNPPLHAVDIDKTQQAANFHPWATGVHFANDLMQFIRSFF